MELLTALVKFAAVMLVAAAATMVAASFIASIPWFKRTTKPIDGDPNFIVGAADMADMGHVRQRVSALKRKDGDESDGGGNDGGGCDGGGGD